MKFGISWVPDDLRTYGALVRRTEAIGVDAIGVADSQAARYRECFVTLTHLFANTERVQAGPLVTNPITRHPAVMAAAIASADELSGGRAFLCIGAGDSGVLNLGLQPARLAELEEYVRTLRGLLHHGRASYHGRECRITCVERPVPILIAANGPRTLKLAGRIADGVLIGSGLDVDSVALLRSHVAAGAAEAERDIADIDLWYMARGALGDTRQEALALAGPSLAGSANHIFRGTTEGKGVPAEYVEPLRELRRRIDPSFKSIPGEQNPNGRLLETLGLTEYLADRLGLVGTEDDVVEKLTRLRAIGIENVMLRPLVIDRAGFLDRFERVIHAVRGSASATAGVTEVTAPTRLNYHRSDVTTPLRNDTACASHPPAAPRRPPPSPTS